MPPTTDPHEVIALERVSLMRDGRVLLEDINWTVRSDQHWVVLGPNGAGKTMMLQIASTYIAPTRGSVRLFGRDVNCRRTAGNEKFGGAPVRVLVSVGRPRPPPVGDAFFETGYDARSRTVDLFGDTGDRIDQI